MTAKNPMDCVNGDFKEGVKKIAAEHPLKPPKEVEEKNQVHKEEKNKQKPLLEAKTSWFHIFRSMIESGDCAKMGEAAVMLYMVIKSYTNWSTGKSWPNHSLLMEKTGYSVAKVNRCLRILEENGYITREKVGRKNRYVLREKFEITDDAGRPCATATFDYLPSVITDAQAELKNFLLSGNDNGLKYVKIDNLNITVNIQNIESGAKGEQNNYSFNTEAVKDPGLRKMIENIEKKRKGRG